LLLNKKLLASNSVLRIQEPAQPLAAVAASLIEHETWPFGRMKFHTRSQNPENKNEEDKYYECYADSWILTS